MSRASTSATLRPRVAASKAAPQPTTPPPMTTTSNCSPASRCQSDARCAGHSCPGMGSKGCRCSRLACRTGHTPYVVAIACCTLPRLVSRVVPRALADEVLPAGWLSPSEEQQHSCGEYRDECSEDHAGDGQTQGRCRDAFTDDRDRDPHVEHDEVGRGDLAALVRWASSSHRTEAGAETHTLAQSGNDRSDDEYCQGTDQQTGADEDHPPDQAGTPECQGAPLAEDHGQRLADRRGEEYRKHHCAGDRMTGVVQYRAKERRGHRGEQSHHREAGESGDRGPGEHASDLAR